MGPRQVVPAAASAVVALLVLGPALGRGVVLAYDLAWSPDPRLTPFALGTSTPAPRAVPSDAAAVVLGWVLGAGPAQALVLWGTLVLAGVGAARLAALLAPDVGLLGRSAAAASPRSGTRSSSSASSSASGRCCSGTPPCPTSSSPRSASADGLAPPWAPAVGLAACGLGGRQHAGHRVPRRRGRARHPATPVAGARARHGIRPRRLGGVGAAGGRPPGSSRRPLGVAAFAARADTPLGVLGSLVSGGGFWNPASHPPGRSVAVVALAAAALALACVGVAARAARREHVEVVLVPALLGLGLAWLSALDPFGLWSAVVLHLPGGGVLRDAQKLLAPWVVLVGGRRRRARPRRAAGARRRTRRSPSS